MLNLCGCATDTTCVQPPDPGGILCSECTNCIRTDEEASVCAIKCQEWIDGGRVGDAPRIWCCPWVVYCCYDYGVVQTVYGQCCECSEE